MKSKFFAPLIVPFLFTTSLLYSQGTVVFEDNFNDQALNESPGSPWTSVLVQSPNTADVVTDGSDWFGQGTSNRILNVRKEQGGSTGDNINIRAFNAIDSADATNLNSFQFSLYQPSDPGFGVTAFLEITAYTSGFGIDERLGRVLIGDSTGRVVNQDGTDWNYDLDAVNDFELIYNTASFGQSVTRNSTSHTIATSSFGLWINGTFQGTSSLSLPETTGNITSFQLVYGTNNSIQQYIDDFSVTAIPEPRAVTLALGLAVLGVALLRRRMKS